MRIGIITMPLRSNYGGILQNYALQTVLKEMGHHPITFRMDKKEYGSWLISSIKALMRLRTPSCPPWIFRKRFVGMERFVDQYIDVTKRQDSFSSSNIEEYGLDALCVGSDQVWRPMYMYYMHLEDMFFQFAKEKTLLKFSYAASFGTSDWEFSDNQIEKCSALIQNFKGISVREESGVELCQKYFRVTAQWVLDPTLLLSAAHYMKLCQDIPQRDKFLYAYILDMSTEKVEFIHKVGDIMGLQVLIVSAGADIKPDDSPEKWISYFRDASYVITDSYHGTIFSIIFHCDFLIFSNLHRGNARFDSLVKMLGIGSQVISDSYQFDKSTRPDWNAIQSKWQYWKVSSYKYLERVLK